MTLRRPSERLPKATHDSQLTPADRSSGGIPPYRISQYLGHANVQTTLSIYAHLFATEEVADMELLGLEQSQPSSSSPRIDATSGTSILALR